ncbi:YfjI family protein [Vibrio artabrorum]|uniref:YfjI family protein n=1 Tax=Vibrio artabrorum TaxID=446374 RepID=A0ABT8CFB2_9VIBR|nr:YfjI family protein [Vibrio artabrorum]MDN3700119.1 YfjI family protein [Vibrio artabrorum]
MSNVLPIGLQGTAWFPYQSVPPYFRNDSTIFRALDNLEQMTQTPRAMNLSAALAASSTSLQGLVDVENPLTGKAGPISLNILTVAGSGERKSSLESKVIKGLKRFMLDDTKRLKRALVRHALIISEYREVEKYLMQEMLDASNEEKDIAIERLVDHQLNEPQAPKPRVIRFEDVTPQALQAELQGVGANAILSSSEGAKILNSLLMRNTSFLNDLWSGEDTRVSRKSSNDIIIEDARLTVAIMTQVSTVKKFITKSTDDVRDNGFFARFLLCYPPSNCGNRQSYGIKIPTEAIDEFNERVYSLLQLLPLEIDERKRRVVKFCYDAKKVLTEISNEIETSMKPGGRFEFAKDHASKLVENTVRVAAILHCFEVYSEDETLSEIPLSTLWDAINIVAYYSSEFMGLFCSPPSPPQYVLDAEVLANWLAQRANAGTRYIKNNYILQYGPNCLRKSKALKAALDYLGPDPRFSQLLVGQTKVIDLFPAHPQDLPKQQVDLSTVSIPPLPMSHY